MKKYILIVQVLIFVLITISGCQSSKEAKVDELFKEYTGQVPGASVMMIRNGQILFKKSYGQANMEEKIPVDTHTNFRLASVTKQFTAMCIMMLVEQNKLKYDQPISDIFPGFKGYGQTITIRNLLQHTSSLVRPRF